MGSGILLITLPSPPGPRAALLLLTIREGVHFWDPHWEMAKEPYCRSSPSRWEPQTEERVQSSNNGASRQPHRLPWDIGCVGMWMLDACQMDHLHGILVLTWNFHIIVSFPALHIPTEWCYHAQVKKESLQVK